MKRSCQALSLCLYLLTLVISPGSYRRSGTEHIIAICGPLVVWQHSSRNFWVFGIRLDAASSSTRRSLRRHASPGTLRRSLGTTACWCAKLFRGFDSFSSSYNWWIVFPAVPWSLGRSLRWHAGRGTLRRFLGTTACWRAKLFFGFDPFSCSYNWWIVLPAVPCSRLGSLASSLGSPAGSGPSSAHDTPSAFPSECANYSGSGERDS
jgi:hypothetical protein